MHPALWAGKTGLDAQQLQLAVVSNNIANVNTVSFKKDMAKFADLSYQEMKQPGGETATSLEHPTGLMVGTGVRIGATQKVFVQGNQMQVDGELNMLIDGNGFFQFQRPDGTIVYSRDGQLQRNGNTGLVVNSEGLPLVPNITIPNSITSLNVSTDGNVSVLLPGSSDPTQLGTIQLAAFLNPAGLKPIGDNLYQESQASGQPQVNNATTNGLGAIKQHALEASNVNIVEELIGLIQTQRAYEMNARTVQTVDGMLEFITKSL